MKRVLFLIPNSSGGAEKVSVNYARILAERGFAVSVVLIKTPTDSVNLREYITDKRITVTDYQWRGVARSWFGLVRYIVRSRCHYAFSSLTTFSILAVIASLFARGMRVVARQCFTPGTESRAMEFCLGLFLRFAYLNIAQTEQMREQMITAYGFKPQRVVTIYNPLNKGDILRKIEAIKPSTEQGYNYVAIGRLSPDKDYMTLLRAFDIVIAARPEARLTIIGNNYNDSYFDSLVEYIAAHGLGDSVEFVGYTTNPYSYMVASDTLVLSSVREGLPNVLLEAMFLNVPIVATESIPFISQYVVNGSNGYRCKVGDFEALAKGMLLAPQLKGAVVNGDISGDVEEQIVDIFSL